ncbi:hypothetical protein TWF694_006101 [Orbilia ellipsospora]|uniref:Oxysterol-binding protein n=1 Tax=Orbilia ellipsospora TaxID=2528407 RepID=A0AAV9WSB7_9PEZI
MKFLSSFGLPSGDYSQGIRDFLSYLPNIRTADLSTISAPTPLLAPKSTVEYPSLVTLHHNLFLLPTTQSDPLDRAVSILENYIATLKVQSEACQQPTTSPDSYNEGATGQLKKPLNPFLGELFLAKARGSDNSETEVVCEQVGHHPPTTASYINNKSHGISVQAHLTQSTTFTPTTASITITQTGHALTTIKNHSEHHLATFPSLRIKGLFSFGIGGVSSEYTGRCQIVSSSGYITRVAFGEDVVRRGTVKERLGWYPSSGDDGKRVSATIHRWREDSGGVERDSQPLVILSGFWNGDMKIRDMRNGKEEVFRVDDCEKGEIVTAPIEKQTGWESQKAWAATKEALGNRDWKRATEEKRKIEEWQRDLRRTEQREGNKWSPKYFGIVEQCKQVERMRRVLGEDSRLGSTFWRYQNQED